MRWCVYQLGARDERLWVFLDLLLDLLDVVFEQV